MHTLAVLLRAVRDDRTDLALEEFSEDEIRWAIDSGLGPLLLRHIADVPTSRASPAWRLLKGADLTARVITAEHLDAMERIVRACAGRTRPPTLLKGISIGGQFYPEPHLRPMRDIDFLVGEDELPVVHSALSEMGYRRRPLNVLEFYESHHHTIPFWHPETGVWVEVHRGLCSRLSPAGADAVFGLDRVNAERRPSDFRGQAVYRLGAELQLIYIASHWAYDFKPVGGLVAVLDMIYLLKATPTIRWQRVLDWLDGAVAASPVYLLLTYIARRRLIELPPGLLEEIHERQRSFGSTSLRIAHGVIERYVMKGADFGPVGSERNIKILWQTLLLPRAPFRKLLLVLWRLLPSRMWLERLVTMRGRPGSRPETL